MSQIQQCPSFAAAQHGVVYWGVEVLLMHLRLRRKLYILVILAKGGFTPVPSPPVGS